VSRPITISFGLLRNVTLSFTLGIGYWDLFSLLFCYGSSVVFSGVVCLWGNPCAKCTYSQRRCGRGMSYWFLLCHVSCSKAVCRLWPVSLPVMFPLGVGACGGVSMTCVLLTATLLSSCRDHLCRWRCGESCGGWSLQD